MDYLVFGLAVTIIVAIGAMAVLKKSKARKVE